MKRYTPTNNSNNKNLTKEQKEFWKQRDNFNLFKTSYRKDIYSNFLFNEASLSMVKKLMKNSGFIIGSAFKDYNTPGENIKKNSNLLKWIRQKKLDFYIVDGVWKDYKTGDIYPELSVLVPYKERAVSFDDFLLLAQEWAKKYDQDAVLVKDPDPLYGKLFILNQDGTTKTMKGKFNPNEVSEIYTKFKVGKDKGKTFILEGVQIPSSGYKKMQMIEQGYLW